MSILPPSFLLWLTVLVALMVAVPVAQATPVTRFSEAEPAVSPAYETRPFEAEDPALLVADPATLPTTMSTLLEDIRPTWQQIDGGGANLGFTETGHWFRLRVVNDTSTSDSRLLEIGYPQLDHVTIFVQQGTSQRVIDTGDLRPFDSRELRHPNFLVRLTLDPGASADVVFHVQTEGSLQFPLTLWTESAFLTDSLSTFQLHALFMGVLAVTLLMSLAFFVVLRDSAYVYYALATFGYLLYFATLRGIAFQYLWPDSPELNSRAFLLSMPMLAFFSLLFARRFMSTPTVLPRFNRLITVMIVAEALNLILSQTAPYGIAVRVSALLAIPLYLVLIVAGPLALLRGNRPARYFTVAWSLLTTGMFITLMHKAGLLPNNMLTEYAMQIGSALEAVLLTIGLAARVYREREDKIQAQSQLLKESAEREAAEAQLMRVALHDPITGLPNRGQLELRLRELQPRGEWFVGVMMLQNYREVAMSLGQDNADQVVRAFAREASERASQLPGIVQLNPDDEAPSWIGVLGPNRYVLVADAALCRAHRDAYERLLTESARARDVAGFRIELNPTLGIGVVSPQGLPPARCLRDALVAAEHAQAIGRAFVF